MVIYLGNNNEVLWLHDDIKIKEQFINDDNCIAIDKKIERPVELKDNKIRVLKYKSDTQELYYEVIGTKEFTQEELVKDTHSQLLINSDDTLINLELNTDTNTKVALAGNDSLLLMEMLVAIDEKLNQLLQPKEA